MSLWMKRGIVTVFLVIFVLCTAAYYLGFDTFGAATRFASIVSFAVLALVLFLVGAFDVERHGPRGKDH